RCTRRRGVRRGSRHGGVGFVAVGGRPFEGGRRFERGAVMARVTVIGAGVIGLSTSIALKRAGHDVAVIAREKGQTTTSAAARAVWLPFHGGPPSRVIGWARRTREELVSIARRSPEAGVDMVDAFIAAESETPPWWAASLDDCRLV